MRERELLSCDVSLLGGGIPLKGFIFFFCNTWLSVLQNMSALAWLVPNLPPPPGLPGGPLLCVCVCVGGAWSPVCLVAGTAAGLPVFWGHVLEEIYQNQVCFKLSTPAQAHLTFVLLL